MRNLEDKNLNSEQENPEAHPPFQENIQNLIDEISRYGVKELPSDFFTEEKIELLQKALFFFEERFDSQKIEKINTESFFALLDTENRTTEDNAHLFAFIEQIRVFLELAERDREKEENIKKELSSILTAFSELESFSPQTLFTEKILSLSQEEKEKIQQEVNIIKAIIPKIRSLSNYNPIPRSFDHDSAMAFQPFVNTLPLVLDAPEEDSPDIKELLQSESFERYHQQFVEVKYWLFVLAEKLGINHKKISLSEFSTDLRSFEEYSFSRTRENENAQEYKTHIDFEISPEELNKNVPLSGELFWKFLNGIRNAAIHGNANTIKARINSDTSEDEIEIKILDNGSGIDRQKVLTVAKEKNVLPDSLSSLSDQEIDNLVFHPKISTSSTGLGLKIFTRGFAERGHLQMKGDDGLPNKTGGFGAKLILSIRKGREQCPDSTQEKVEAVLAESAK
ncbi:hypothetical protein K9M59_00170 [Candidatus Gracilibacteria bacterium]|nr:hypothetical protein [Candidatus Gracilibacteria bacterium]MCF7819000.1 hypothetical protein [Candidatus Gracilibacteria bacterium]